jgi:ribonuclease-3
VTLKAFLGFSRLPSSPLRDYFKSRFNLRLKEVALYQQALTHKSFSNKHLECQHNEKLEFLGDAILGAIFSSYLYQAYPSLDEGMLTKLRARVVNRQNLTEMALTLGLDKYIRAEKNLMDQRNNSLPGNALEAVVGAMYLERGYSFTRKFILRHLLPIVEEARLLESDTNHKSRLLEWGQKHNKTVNMSTEETNSKSEARRFKSIVQIDERSFPAGYGRKKKYAEQDAALGALMELGEI